MHGRVGHLLPAFSMVVTDWPCTRSPFVARACTLAPRSSRSVSASARPDLAASCKAVKPKRSPSISPPRSHACRSEGRSPSLAASWSAGRLGVLSRRPPPKFVRLRRVVEPGSAAGVLRRSRNVAAVRFRCSHPRHRAWMAVAAFAFAVSVRVALKPQLVDCPLLWRNLVNAVTLSRARSETVFDATGAQ